MKSKIKLLVMFLAIIYSLSSCVTNKQTNLLQDIQKNYPTTTAPDKYTIIPGDLLYVSVYSWNPETQSLFQAGTSSSTPLTVYADGTINLPYVGKIYVRDLSILEARQIISAKLNTFSEGTAAEVSLANNFFSILGESGARKVTMNNNSMTIYQALAIANTIGPYADKSKVSILRQTKDGSTIKTFDLRSKDIIDTEYYYIQPNDVIYFPQMKSKFFGATTSFAGIFGLVTSAIGIIILTIRLF